MRSGEDAATSAGDEIGEVARRAVGHVLRGGGDAPGRGMEVLGRVGLVAYGVLHLTIAGLAGALLVDGGTSARVDPGVAAAEVGALGGVGYALIVVAVVGLVAFGVWQVLAAARGFRWTSGGERTRKRIGAAAKAVAVFAAAFSGIPVVTGDPVGDSGAIGRALTGELLALPAGRVLTGGAAVAVLGVTASMFYTGLRATFMGDLWGHRLSRRWWRVAMACGSFGTLARAVVIGGVGTLLAIAAVTGDPSRFGGFDRVLRLIASTIFGAFGLAAVSAGIAAFGVFCLFDAYARRP